jgi:hypothetical protein
MDGVFRGRRVLLTPGTILAIGHKRLVRTVCAIGLIGCTAGSAGSVGFSPPRAAEHPASATDAAAPEASRAFANFRLHMVRISNRFLSGHGERFDAVVWVNAAAQSALGAQRQMDDGALLIEDTTVHDARGEWPTGLLVMEKRQGQWSFASVAPDGATVTDRRVAPCATCHRDARDSVFPVTH